MKLTKMEEALKNFQKTIKDLLASGRTPKEAVNEAYKLYPVMKAMQSDLLPQLVAQAQKGGAADVPKEKLQKYMAQSWAKDGLTLSQRTTKGAKAVVTDCTKVIQTSLENGEGVYNMAKKLFEGYKAGGVIPEQDIPKFLDKLTDLTQDYRSNSFKRAMRAAQRNINKLSTQGMKAAYNGVLDALEKGNEEKLEKAIHIATQERTRYFAQRIARTEIARAYADGVFYRWYTDPDCVAFKWGLSSRHPCDDICDMYAHADLWNLGEGIFPKDKVPRLPTHPNCMCRIEPVMTGSKRLKTENPIDNIIDGGLAYILSLTKKRQVDLLGKNGREMVLQGELWTDILPQDEVMETRIVLPYQPPFNKIEGAHTYKQDLSKINPNFYTRSYEWTENCQRCVSAYEARLRGYDVTALPFLPGEDELSYLDADVGLLSIYENPVEVKITGLGANMAKNIDKQMKVWGDGSRAIVVVDWKKEYGGGGHAFFAMRKNGKTLFLDPQNGQDDVDDYFDYAKRGGTEVIRIDNLKFTKRIELACKNWEE